MLPNRFDPRLALVALACTATFACGPEPFAGDPREGLACDPGSTVECACATGEAGVQACDSAGFYGACSCEACVPGRSESCTCGDGRLGARLCGSDGSFGACACTGDLPDGGSNAGTHDGGDGSNPDGGDLGGHDGGGPAGPTGSVVFHAGEDGFVDFFPTARGLVVVRKTGVDLVAPDGRVLKTVASPREITAAAFDGTLLGVADRAVLNVYDTDLAALRSVNLVQACASAVAVGDARFVCGPGNDWDRVFSVYSMSAGTLLGSSRPYTYNGIPMRRVPGTDDFITVTTNMSPTDYHLYRVNADSSLTFFGESPYHGAFPVSGIFAFDASPATRVIGQTGVIVDIYTPTCDGAQPRHSCFERSGELGTLAGQESFLTLGDDGAGTLYGVLHTPGASYFDPLCTSGCSVQRIDLASRTIRAEMNLTDSVHRIVVSRFDPFRRRFSIAYLRRAGSSSSHDTPTEWRIASIAFP